ncbi:LuxR C-terminal-related transcriptional regulator [Marinobacterium aestuariivivens]|uniref:LuxR C-terminal-related transcriptional regulator n=1 Tax=Marinobacterium aestuariivivens TaxID=1698799 RepID=A0ABW1ZXU2_9GAMM
MTKLNVLIADRSPIYRLGIQIALQNAGLDCIFWEVEAWSEVQETLARIQNADLLVLDDCLPELGHFRQLERLLTSHVELPVLILADVASSNFVREAYLSGASGVVLKSSSLDKLSEALCSVLKGSFLHPENDKCYWINTPDRECPVDRSTLLSEKEKHVLKHLKDGLRNKQIALQMCLTESTIKSHLSSIYRKLNVDNRTRLAISIQKME